jgi:lipopolysaccharide/colanic/teichoic acid biosynthesis glycosyltransferase
MEAIPLATRFNDHLVDAEAVRAADDQAKHATLRLRRERPSQGSDHVRPLRCPWYPSCKNVVDFVTAAALAVFALPVVLLAAAVVKLTSRGPAFYTQTRVGQDGRLFAIYKLRTMIHNCESLTGPRWSIPGDPRVTRVGRVLRLTHLDELPQLLNVLRGEMSLIGPRPERPEFVPELARALPGYWQRLTVRPGVTGLAQVQLPPDADLTSVRRKLAHDLYYIQQLSPWLDLRLLACTAFYALGIPFTLLSRFLGIPGGEEVEQAMQGFLGESQAPPSRLSA